MRSPLSFLLLIAVSVATGQAQSATPTGAVGFTQRWVVDSSRRLPDGEKYGLRYRPVLVNIWYPAVATNAVAMRRGDYVAQIAEAPGARGFRVYAESLAAYQQRVSWSELAGSDRADATPELRSAVDAFLAAPTGAARDVPWRRDAARVVVYAQGSGASLDDNVALCELLASQGYIVVGGAFPSEDNERFSTNASDESRQRDIRRALLELTRITGRDPGKVVAIGHSAGAQALLLMATDPSAPIDAVLSLDTTQDYQALSDRLWAYFTDRVVGERAYLRRPIAFVAGPEALFELADSLRTIPRTLVTVRGLDHNDFISQGIEARRLRPGQPGVSTDTARRPAAGDSYAALNEYVLAWIESFHTNGGTSPPRAARSELMSVEFVEVGRKYPADPTSPLRSARDLRHRFGTLTPTEFAADVRAFRATATEQESDLVVAAIVMDAVRRGADVKANAALRALRDAGVPTAGVLDSIRRRAQLLRRIGEVRGADELTRIVELLSGGD